MVSPPEWEAMKDQARMFLHAGCLPNAIKKPEEAMVVMLKGRELGIPPMAALSSIFLIKGTPALSAQLMLALCRRDLPGFRHRIVETTDKIARVWVKRPGEEPAEYSFTISEAEAAGLLYVKPGNQPGNWQKYPKRMLLWRAISFACRTECPEIILGCYTPEEAMEFDERDVTPPSAPKPVYLPGIDPRSTAEDFVSRLRGVEGGMAVIHEQIKKYLEQGYLDSAESIRAALGPEPEPPPPPAPPTVPEEELLPFEKGG